jgi:hypothetical protein
MPTYSLDPLNPARLVCGGCRQGVALVDPLAVPVSGEMTARQAFEACPHAAEAISRHEFACPAVQGQGERRKAGEGPPPPALAHADSQHHGPNARQQLQQALLHGNLLWEQAHPQGNLSTGQKGGKTTKSPRGFAPPHFVT